MFMYSRPFCAFKRQWSGIPRNRKTHAKAGIAEDIHRPLHTSNEQSCFSATNPVYCVCRSAGEDTSCPRTVVQGWLLHLCAGRGCYQHSRLLRRYFMPGKSPPCRILTLTAKNCKSFLFREKKPPISDRNNDGNRGERNTTSSSRQNASVGHFWTNVRARMPSRPYRAERNRIAAA